MANKVKYVIGHWTGVNFYYVTPDIKKHYQMLIDGDGDVIEGEVQGYTSSTGGMNSITYNIACCGGDLRAPLKKKQCERFFKECAIAIKKYGLTVADVYTHAEIGEMCRNYIDLKNGKTVKGDFTLHSETNCDVQKLTSAPLSLRRLITELLPWNDYLMQNIGKIDLNKLPYDVACPSGADNYTKATAYGNFIRNKIKWYITQLIK